MNSLLAYDVIYIGNYTKDTIITPDGTRYTDGGAVNYAAHAAARLGLHVAVVSRLADEDVRVVEKWEQADIDSYITYVPESTCMKLEYPTYDPDIRTLSVTSIAGSIIAGDVEPIQSRAAVIGSSLRGEVGIDVIRVLREKHVLVAADMQGFVRVLQGRKLVYAPWPEMDATLAELDILKSDAVEAEFLTGEKDIYKAARIFSAKGPKEIVLTHKDGVLFYANGEFSEQAFYPAQMNGRSGRGDTCIGAYVAMRLFKSPVEAGVWAAAVTSLKMENLGPFTRSVADVEALIRAKYNHRTAS
jgi:sugar/nucleoside kinase (ribokinase family)